MQTDLIKSIFVANCGNLAAKVKNQSTLTIEYDYPALDVEGASVIFACSQELILSGPSASTCMGNGKWEPDPRDVECKSKFINLRPDHESYYYYVHNNVIL